MKAILSFLFLYAAALGMSSANASPITYDINESHGGGSVIGTIATNGTIGSGLSASIITNWNITVNDGTHSSTLTEGNSTLTFLSSELTASATELDFNFGATPGYIKFNDASNFPVQSFFDIFVDVTLPSFTGSGMQWGVASDNSTVDWQLIGNPFPDTLRFPSATTPLPAALPLFASALGGLGLLGWRRKRKAAALAA